jgi:hypothetical protein
MSDTYDVNSPDDVGRVAALLGTEIADDGMTKGELRIRKYLARGDFFEQSEIVLVEQWLDAQERARAVAATRTPEALALRSTIATERSAISAKHSVIISFFALAIAIAALIVSLLPQKLIN